MANARGMAGALGVALSLSGLGCGQSAAGDGDDASCGATPCAASPSGGAPHTPSDTGGAAPSGGAEEALSGGALPATGGALTGGDVGGGSGGGQGPIPPEAPDSGCESPALWPAAGEARVVGDGTPASCTAAALAAAVSASGQVTFDCGLEPVSIAISTQLEVSGEVMVDGADRVTLDGGGTSRIFTVTDGSALSARHLRFVGGATPATMEAEGIGGAIAGRWRSRVEVVGCTFEDNAAARGGGAVAVWTGSELSIVESRFLRNRSWYGGAVYSLLSPLTIVDSEFVDNYTADDGEGTGGEGGAIGTDGASEYPDDALGGDVRLCGVQITDSRGRASGGGAYVWVYPPDRVLVERSTIRGNSAAGTDTGGALGGGMRLSNGEITVSQSSFLSNEAASHGGGLYLDCAPTCTIVNTTFDGNSAGPSDASTPGYGGAIFGDHVVVRNVTFARNFAAGHGGALFAGEDWTITSSLFVDNESGNPWGQARSCGATWTGADVLQWVSATGDGGSDLCVPDILSADPLLAAQAADNGGPTPTLLLGAGSPALGAGTECEAFDQRGEPRDPASCDLGAVELP